MAFVVIVWSAQNPKVPDRHEFWLDKATVTGAPFQVQDPRSGTIRAIRAVPSR